MRIGALVPARISSKRILKKNIRHLGGKPLICWTIDTLLESEVFNSITVSTESEAVIDTVRRYYTKNEVQIHRRPAKFATDDASLTSVIRHYLKSGPDIDWLGLFMPTFPFRTPEKLKKASSAISSFYPWRVTSITMEEDCSMDFYYPSTGGVKLFFRHQPFYASYDLPVYSMHNIHVPDDLWGNYGLAISERTFKIHLTAEECIDVDTESDFALANKIAGGARLCPTSTKQIETEKWRITLPSSVDSHVFLAFVRDKLRDTNNPLLVLDPARPALSFYRYFDGNIRTYWVNHEAHEYLSCGKYKTTGNGQHCPLHYRHSQLYRFVRKSETPGQVNSQFSDEKGILCLSGVGNGPDSVVKDDRVIHVEQLRKAGFLTDQYTVVENANISTARLPRTDH